MDDRVPLLRPEEAKPGPSSASCMAQWRLEKKFILVFVFLSLFTDAVSQRPRPKAVSEAPFLLSSIPSLEEVLLRCRLFSSRLDLF